MTAVQAMSDATLVSRQASNVTLKKCGWSNQRLPGTRTRSASIASI